jgi:peptidoglycan/xylan/chitin deacetylase (PgdA/CDA1 family)
MLLEGFENVADWYVGGSNTTSANNTSIFKQGSQSIKLNAVNGTYSYLEKINLSLDFSSGDNFSVWIYIEDKTKASTLGIAFTSTTNWSKYFEKYWSVTEQGWNYYILSKSELTNNGGDSWDNKMVRMRVIMKPKTGQDTSVNFDDLRFGIESKAKVIITFDDTFISQIDKAYPIMATNGQKGVAFPNANSVGASGRLTLANLQTLKAAGWDISNHTAAHKNLTEVSQAEMEADIDAGYDWLVANGFGSTAKFFAYPFAAYNDTVIAKVKQRHVLARGWSYFQYHFYLFKFEDLQYKLGHYVIENTTSVATVQAKIDATISKGGLLTFLFHDIVDSNPGTYNCLTADFQAISDYLKTKQDAGLLEVITFSDYYNALIELEPFCLEEPAMDFNGDCKVDFADFALFTQIWLDCKVDFADFALFTQSWLDCNLDPESACWE